MSSIIIIGGGIAGLSAGCYGRMNGYDTTIFEMHDQPGGLCTSWERKGYTIDGCIHWVVGTAPGTAMNTIWRELGALQGRPLLHHEVFKRIEFPSGEPIVLYTDLDRLEEHLLRIAPEDRRPIRELTSLFRRFRDFDFSPDKAPELQDDRERLWFLLRISRWLPWIWRYRSTSVADFAARFHNGRLRLALECFFFPEMPLLFMAFTFALLSSGDAAYPIGGSLPFARAIERRFLDLGGRIAYGSKVARVLVEEDRAVGVELADGTRHLADDVIAAGDMHTAVHQLLGGRYQDEVLRGYFRDLEPFPPLVYIGLGLSRPFSEVPLSVGGLSLPLSKPIRVDTRTIDRLSFQPYHHDPTLAPAGKTVAVVVIATDYDYWSSLCADREAYRQEKKRLGREVVAALDRRFPGLAADVEMIDVASPTTFERYTGNYRGSFEGWQLTPDNIFTEMRKTLPGLDRFLLAGQWVNPGGGLPPAAFSGRHAIQILCQRDGRPFVTSLPPA